MSSNKFAVFDIDGTLIRWQLYHAVVDRLAKKELLGKDAKVQLHKARMHWKDREHPDAFREYELELISIYESALPFLTASEFDTAAQEIANEYKTQIYTFTRDLAQRLKKSHYTLIAISGSHQELLEYIAKQYEFDIYEGSKYERIDGRFTGKKTIGSHNKATTLKRIVSENQLTFKDSYAIGDSKSDAQLLELVEHPIAFNPDQELFEQAKKSSWNIVVERKNVIYNLQRDNSTQKYTLKV